MAEQGDIPEEAAARTPRTWPFLLVLLAIVLAFEGALVFGVVGIAPDAENLGRLFGRATAALIVPALIVIPWRAAQKRSGRFTRTPLVVATIGFVVAYVAMLAQLASR